MSSSDFTYRGLSEPHHQIFRAGWSHRLLQLPELPRQSKFLQRWQTRAPSPAPAQSCLLPRGPRSRSPRQKTERSTRYLGSQKSFSLHLFHLISRWAAAEEPTPAPALQGPLRGTTTSHLGHQPNNHLL